MLGVIQNFTTFVTTGIGLGLITAALAAGFVAVLCRFMYWHTLGEMALAGAGIVGVAALVNTVF
jgi:hypothetical protein